MIGSGLIMAHCKIVRKKQLVPAMNLRSQWHDGIAVFMAECGWVRVRDWKWVHGILDGVELDFSTVEAVQASRPNAIKHVLREAWRAENFQKWKASGRLDALECMQVPYCARRVKAVRNLCQGNEHTFAILAGACSSLGRRLNHSRDTVDLQDPGLAVGLCPFCKLDFPTFVQESLRWQFLSVLCRKGLVGRQSIVLVSITMRCLSGWSILAKLPWASSWVSTLSICFSLMR